MFQIGNLVLINPMISASADAAIASLNPGIPYDLEILLITTKPGYFSSISLSKSVLECPSSLKSTNDSSIIILIPIIFVGSPCLQF